MTDHIKGLIITFERDIREDDVDPIIEAIQMVRGVADVSRSVADSRDHMNRERIRREMREKLWEVLK